MKKSIKKDYFCFKRCEYEFNLINQQIKGCLYKDSNIIDITKCGKNCPYYKEVLVEVCTSSNNCEKIDI